MRDLWILPVFALCFPLFAEAEIEVNQGQCSNGLLGQGAIARGTVRAVAPLENTFVFEIDEQIRGAALKRPVIVKFCRPLTGPAKQPGLWDHLTPKVDQKAALVFSESVPTGGQPKDILDFVDVDKDKITWELWKRVITCENADIEHLLNEISSNDSCLRYYANRSLHNKAFGKKFDEGLRKKVISIYQDQLLVRPSVKVGKVQIVHLLLDWLETRRDDFANYSILSVFFELLMDSDSGVKDEAIQVLYALWFGGGTYKPLVAKLSLHNPAAIQQSLEQVERSEPNLKDKAGSLKHLIQTIIK